MPLVQPFRALRPAPGRAAEILAPPYDVLSSAEARQRAAGKPWSFLHVSKPEIDLDPGISQYDAAVYARGAENLKRMVAEGIVVRDRRPSYYVYRLTWRGRRQTGVATVASVAAYDANRIRRHELTTPVKEDDRVRQIEAVDAETGPVMIAYRNAPAVDAILAAATEATPAFDVAADDGVRHEMWVMSDAATVDRLTAAVDALPAIYIADGHHRSAAASRIARARPGSASAAMFLAVLFPAHQMTILDYNRLVRDLNGRSPAGLLAALGEKFAVAAEAGPVSPRAPGEFGMFLDGGWHRLTLRGAIPEDPIGRLPVTVLTRNVLEPLFAILDQRTDKRIDFVGGGRGLGELAKRVAGGDFAVAFALHPTSMTDLMAVADANQIMPPKSTWFEPKLADGVVSHVLD